MRGLAELNAYLFLAFLLMVCTESLSLKQAIGILGYAVFTTILLIITRNGAKSRKP